MSALNEPLRLAPELLEKIENLQIVARQVAEGTLAGMHLSKRHGTSIEFSEHKVYTPGDDIRHIDWHAYAKTDRFHVKRFEDETNLRLELIVDHSSSMGFPEEPPKTRKSDQYLTKLEYANSIAAGLSYLALRQGDATGLTTFAERPTHQLPPRAHSAHLVEILTRLAQLEPGGKTQIAHSIDTLAQRQMRPSVIILLSDLFDPSPELLPSLKRLAARRHEVNILHILDPDEIDFPYENPATFESIEDNQSIFIHPRTLRQTYLAEMAKFLKETERRFSANGLHYKLMCTAENPGHLLAEFLRSRQNRRRSATP